MNLVTPLRKKKTDTVSLRINSDLRFALEEEARQAGISFTSRVSQILTEYDRWGRYAEKLSFLPASKDLFREIFNSMPEDAIEKVARGVAQTSAHEEILFFFRRKDLDTIVGFLELWGSHFDASEHDFDGKRHVFTLHHDVNLNYSLFVKEYVSSLVRSIAPRTVQFETISPNAVTFSFEG